MHMLLNDSMQKIIQVSDFADEIGIVEEPTTWTDLVKANEPIG